MGKPLKTTFFSIAFLLILSTVSLAGQFKVSRVYDGDTIKVEGHDIEVKVRLVGIDTPEMSKGKRQPSQPYAVKAKKYLASMVLNKTVNIKGYGLDRYNRILGVIHLNDKNINLEMIKAGLAEVYRGRPPKGFDSTPYLNAEAAARESKTGMWIQGDKHISPKQWRGRSKRY